MANGCNAQACEAQLKISKEQSLLGERVWEQIRVCDMGKPPYNFPEPLTFIQAFLTLWTYLLTAKP